MFYFNGYSIINVMPGVSASVHECFQSQCRPWHPTDIQKKRTGKSPI